MIAVTGSSGFVGVALIAHLAERGHAFRAIAREDYVNSTAFQGCNTVIHLAGLAHRGQTSLRDFRRINRDLALETAKAAGKSGVSRFVYVSSSKALRDFSNSEIPLDESSQANPGCDYGLSKLEAEKALMALALEDVRNPRITIVRPALVVGSPPKANLRMLAKIAMLKPDWLWRELLSPFKAKRSFLSLGNLCEALELCALQPGTASHLFHVADEAIYSTHELFALLQRAAERLQMSSSPPTRNGNRLEGNVFPLTDHLRRRLLGGPIDWSARLCLTILRKPRIYEAIARPLVLNGEKIRKEFCWRPKFEIDVEIQHIIDHLINSKEDLNS